MKLDQGFFEKCVEIVKKSDTSKIVITPLAVGMLGLAALIFFPNPTLSVYYSIWISFWFTIVGIAMIIKKEIPRPGHSSIKGFPVILIGILWILFFGFVTIYLSVR